jgi:hypothetical protein
MKKLLLPFLLFVTSLCYATIYDVQWYSVDADTTAHTVKWNYRGNMFFVYNSTSTDPLIADCTSFVRIYSTGTVEAVNLFVTGDFLVPFVDTGTTPSRPGLWGRTAQWVIYTSTAAVDFRSWQRVGSQ